MHFKVPCYGLLSLLLMWSLSACGFKFIGENKINPILSSICISSSTKTQFRQRLMQRLRASQVQLSDTCQPGSFHLSLAQEALSDEPDFGDATQARTYTMDFSIKLNLQTDKGQILLDRVFSASTSIIVSPNHRLSANDQMNTARMKLFDQVISELFFASHSSDVEKALLTPVNAEE